MIERNGSPTKQVNYSCGCKFTCQTEAQAVAHVRDSGHIITANGVIKPFNDRPKQVKSIYRGEYDKDGIQETRNSRRFER